LVEFQQGPRKLTVINVNRSGVEHALGVDLVYYNHEFDSYVLVQYKRMKSRAVFLAAGWVVLGLDLQLWLRFVLGSGLSIVAGAIFATSFRGSVPRLYVVGLVVTGFWVLGGPWLLPVPAAIRLLIMLGALAVWISVVAGLRSRVCEWAYERTFFAPNGRGTLLPRACKCSPTPPGRDRSNPASRSARRNWAGTLVPALVAQRMCPSPQRV
jgi:hypothetical protein